ncbi:MAG: excinuclease ABC subunit UvrA [Firmicutes bacterium]|nr:excinuclease ABC subunit UvrA [Bacillota bacterium]
MNQDKIRIRGAREHNLKNIDVDIPRNQLVVVTGVSGSGKSSLAFDTIYAEGQRRYVESLSSYARQFLGQMDKPDVDYIEGLSPAISIDQKTTSRNPRSTVGTVTEIYDYLRLLYARVGHPHCPHCGIHIAQQTVEQMVDHIMKLPEKTKIQVLAPLVRGRKGEYHRLFADTRSDGFVRVRVDGELRELEEEIVLEKNKKHSIEIVVDRLIIKKGLENRLADSLETSLKYGNGLVLIDVIDGEELLFSSTFACPQCGFSYEDLAPRMFSFNSPYGACPACSGLGYLTEIDPDLVIPDKRRTLREGAIAPWKPGSQGYYQQILLAAAAHADIDLDTPYVKLPKAKQKQLMYGMRDRIPFTYEATSGRVHQYNLKYDGIMPMLEKRYKETTSGQIREDLESYMSAHACSQCAGARLKPASLAVTINECNISQLTALTVEKARVFVTGLQLSEKEQQIARLVLRELNERLGFLQNVGLDYLTLDRAAGTLSGGEAQRIRLATQIGSSLTGVLYILDEPSIGLHQRDNARLIQTLLRLRDLGNTVIVVEHDEETIEQADHILDIGPGAGAWGGWVVAAGTAEEIKAVPESLTGQYLSRAKSILLPETRREPNGKWLEIKGARANNLKNLDVRVPLGVFTCVTGVSGSGKSTLVNEILYRRLAQELHRSRHKPAQHDELLGLEYLDKVIDVDQSPIGRTPRSNPATYTGVFDIIRDLFSRTSEGRARGYKPGRFSFNVKGGRCEACRGDGILRIEMHFLPDVYVPCEVCHGKRYNRETQEIRYKGKNIADVLEMTVAEAVEFFDAIPRIKRKLQTLFDVGLGYIRLGQPAPTLSGGEAQRVKLATELSRRSNGKTLYILDEPTTGLHTDDIKKLLHILDRLVESGDSVLVIEHNLDVIKRADYIIDLGPEGGDAGGEIVACGTPEAVCSVTTSHTGRYLKKYLASRP